MKDGSGQILAAGKVATDPQALFEKLRKHCLCPEQIVMETGTLSNRLGRKLLKLGLEVDVIDARKAHAVLRLQHNKTDANDAEVLSDLARTSMDLSRFRAAPVAHLYGPFFESQGAFPTEG